MTIFEKFTPSARGAMVRAGLLARDAGRDVLDEDVILLALAETRPFEAPLGSFAPEPDAVRAAVVAGDGATDRELLATLGIDLAEIRRRMPGPVDDPARWRLRRSRTRPLRVVLYGPAGGLVLTGKARKVVEVAMNRRGPTRGPAGRVTGEDLLCGLLADGSNRSLQIMRGAGVDPYRLAADLGFLRKAA
ncbi:hypothetical protein [Sphaerisporangium corydalis]|uniref:Clp R domain-containing protein n=1 Tax=Sphaerisporangium corydalis TaxID=1441875 RepID=A0ABV9ES48_9ACTN|nr:hypothetical protein [Sphaerisporangium corydalis]